MEVHFIEGGINSGNHGHKGRPGKVGGSSTQGISKEDSFVVDFYTGSGYIDINRYLREGEDYFTKALRPRSRELLVKCVNSLDKLTSNELPYGKTLYRGLNWNLEVGQEFTDKAFISTSIEREIADNRAQKFGGKVHRIVGASKGYYVGNSDKHFENEVILPRNLTFRVEPNNVLRII